MRSSSRGRGRPTCRGDLHPLVFTQIRIHPAVAGHPLVGDPFYAAGGRPRTDWTAVPGDGGYVLHAERLVFAHPVSGKAMAPRATPPVELRTVTEP
jgi:23S rRNA pseudouridine1911/1915/1917 synthase